MAFGNVSMHGLGLSTDLFARFPPPKKGLLTACRLADLRFSGSAVPAVKGQHQRVGVWVDVWCSFAVSFVGEGVARGVA